MTVAKILKINWEICSSRISHKAVSKSRRVQAAAGGCAAVRAGHLHGGPRVPGRARQPAADSVRHVRHALRDILPPRRAQDLNCAVVGYMSLCSILMFNSILLLILTGIFYVLSAGYAGLSQVEVSQLTCSVCVQGWLSTLMLQLEAACPGQQPPVVTRSKV